MTYEWQGEPVKIKHVIVTVKKNEEKPLWWFNFECDEYGMGHSWAVVPAILIETKNESFIIANHHGIGIHKVTRGGWPNHQHFSIGKESIKKVVDEKTGSVFWKYTEFDELRFSEHEAKRRKWQQEHFPEEFEKSETLRRLIVSNRKNRS